METTDGEAHLAVPVVEHPLGLPRWLGCRCSLLGSGWMVCDLPRHVQLSGERQTLLLQSAWLIFL